MSESPAEVAHADLRSGTAIRARFHCGFHARRRPRFDTLTDTLRSGRGWDFRTWLDPEFENSLGKHDDLDTSGRGWTGYIRIRNQQVSGSSPLAGSNRINNLKGLARSAIAAVSALCRHPPPHRPARTSVARQHRERPRPTPPLSRRGRRCLPFDRVRPSPVFSSAALRTYPCAAERFGPGTSRPVAQAASHACAVNTNDPTAGLSIPANPPRVSVQHRRSLPATRGHGKRQRLAPLFAQTAARGSQVDRRQPQLPPRERPPKPGTRGACYRSSTYSITCTTAVRPRRANGPCGSGSRCSIVAAEHRRLAVRQPPRRGSRHRQPLLALVVRVVEHRDFDPLSRLAPQERQRAARRRVAVPPPLAE